MASAGAGSNLCAKRDVKHQKAVHKGAEHSTNAPPAGPWHCWVRRHAQRGTESSRVAAFPLGADRLRGFYPSLGTLPHLLSSAPKLLVTWHNFILILRPLG